MTFFKRTKICFWGLCLIEVVLFICFFIKLLDGTVKDVFLNPDNHIVLLFAIGILIVLSIILIVLKCIIADAKEDFSAAFNVNNITKDKD